MKNIQKEIKDCFESNFGRTPLTERLKDIEGEVNELCRFTDVKNLKEETGDLLSSVIQLCNENDWEPEELIRNTLNKIEKRKIQYRSLGRKTKIALIGGAFDPPTIGHIKLAQFVLDSSKTFDEVYLMPCFSHMYGKEMESPEDRLNMCELAASVDGRIKVFDYEIKKELKGETYKFVKSLLDEDFAKNECDFSLVIGLDNANAFEKWVNYDILERMMRFVIVPRKGVQINHNIDWYLRSPHIFLSPDHDIPEISSTQVRDKLKHGVSIEGLVEKEVEEYILKKGLYNANENRIW